MSVAFNLIQTLVEKIPEGIIVLHETELVYANSAALSMFGYDSAQTLPSNKFIDVVLPSIPSLLKGEKLPSSIPLEMVGYTRDGKTIDVEVRVLILDHPDATFLLTVRDITVKKMEEREQALWIKEQEALNAIDKTLLGETNLDTLLQIITEQTVSLLHADWAAIVLYDAVTHTAQWKTAVGNKIQVSTEPFPAEGLWQALLWAKEIQICDGEHTSALCTLHGIRELVEEGIMSIAIVPLRTETGPKGILFVGYRQNKDFSGREIRLLLSLAEKNSLAMLNTQLYADLRQREAELEKLAGVRVQAQEEERRKIAREIHDGLGQLLTAIKFNLEILEDALQVSGEQRERIEDMKRLLDHVMQAARELSYNLMPSVLDDFGLIPALQVYCDQVTQRYKQSIRFQAHGVSERLPAEWEIGLYRIVQESLMVIQKLGSTDETDIQLLKLPHVLRLTLEATTKKELSSIPVVEINDIDIVSIRERASLLGGTLSIETSGEKGILLCVELPLNNEGGRNT